MTKQEQIDKLKREIFCLKTVLKNIRDMEYTHMEKSPFEPKHMARNILEAYGDPE